MKSIFIFRRDYRFYDNKTFIKCHKESDKVYPIFIFTPEQIKKNKLKSNNSVQFLVESLHDLKGKVSLFYGDNVSILKKIYSKIKFDCVYFNKDYTPYAKKRDSEIEKWCKEKEIKVVSENDYLLQTNYLKSDETMYVKFTPYFNNAKKKKVDKPIKDKTNKIKTISGITITYDKAKSFYKENKNIHVKGGRENALKILKNIKNFKEYNKKRNILDYETTHLSAYMKFGCVSCREVYYAVKDKLGINSTIIQQLYWRDFYLNILNHFPDLYKSNTRKKMNKIDWNKSESKFKKWCDGETGFPVIDAAMKQMNTTGYMHNRARLIVSSFLIFNLGIHWKKGEEYFAKKLVDYDISSNNGNWKWVAAIESFSNDYFKAMAVISQANRFDPSAIYIKHWLPDLKNIIPKHLLDWEKYHNKYPDIKYPKPILNSKETRKDTLSKYKKVI